MKQSKWKEGHPCLCDKCLEARDGEIARVRKKQRQEIVEEIEKEKLKMCDRPLAESHYDRGFYWGYNQAIDDILAHLKENEKRNL